MIRPVTVFVLYLLVLSCDLFAGTPSDLVPSLAIHTAVADAGTRVEALDRSIDDVLKAPAYQWRMPRDTRAGTDDPARGVLAEFLRESVRSLARVIDWIADKAGRVMEWVSDRIPRPLPGIGYAGRTGHWQEILTIVLGSLLVLILVVLAWIGLRYLRDRRKAVRRTPSPAPVAVDLDDASVRADCLPVSDWLAMANALEHDGNLRHAMRALFLAALAALGQRGWIRIAPHKSNRDYARELDQRARVTLRAAFAASMHRFEQSWYGDYPVLPETIRQGQALLERINNDADI